MYLYVFKSIYFTKNIVISMPVFYLTAGQPISKAKRTPPGSIVTLYFFLLISIKKAIYRAFYTRYYLLLELYNTKDSAHQIIIIK